ncbi:MAG: 3'-5' exonuclease [Puniceicoccales bacterium]|jgi:DNA polymerase-3 subunit epsilon|nr:3'-5' exonuclease [Puniceicoccales bacterium]
MPNWKTIPIHVMDFEGSIRTGIVEYGIVTLLDGEITATSTRLCAPMASIPVIDTQCHGLRDSDLTMVEPVSNDWELFSGLRRTGVFAAHHAPVEQSLIKTVWAYPGAMPDHARPDGAAINEWGPWIDTCRLAATWYPRLADFKLSALVDWFRLEKKLEKLAAQFCPPHRSRYHCALYDALASALLLRHLCAQPDFLNVSVETLIRDSLRGSRQTERMQGELELF